jgi:signal transduction histidine kinase
MSGVTVLAAAVLVLLPALAWLQYTWLDQIADADRDRRARTLQTAASQLARELDGELGKAVFGLQLDPAMVELGAWSQFSERYQTWADTALTPDIVSRVYFVDAPSSRIITDTDLNRTPALRVWNKGTGTFDSTAWPDELSAIRSRFERDGRNVMEIVLAPRRGERGDRSGPRMQMPPIPMGDEHTVVVPVVRVAPPTEPPAAHRHEPDMNDRVRSPGPPDVRLLGFTIVRFDADALSGEVLPTLVRKHLFDDKGYTDYLIGVVARDDPSRVLYESEPGAAGAALAAPDTTTTLHASRLGPYVFMSRDGRREVRSDEGRDDPARPPAPSTPDNLVVSVIEARRDDRGFAFQARTFGGGDGHWRLVAKHRAGSLEAAVAAARTRNFALSSGILALLGTVIGLIVVSARRAARLASQQMAFVAAVSHELRTPVSVIGAAAGNLADGVVDEPGRVKRYGLTIQTEARRLAETVERVLQLAGIAAGRAAASPTLVPGHTLVNDALAAVRHDIETSRIAVERDMPDALPSVQGDALALRSALQNLLSNAAKYAGEARWMRVSARRDGGMLRIAVEDRGLGISAEDRRHIFEPFYRGRDAVSRQIQGSGLGLHLVRRIAEAHGGSVSVQSEPGRGSTFTLELPVADDVAASVPAGHESAAAART